MKKLRAVFVVVALAAAAFVSSAAQEPKATAPKAAEPPSPAHEAKPGREYSGMYSFLQEGEFVQITVEEEGRVTGFVSRYGDGENDKGSFLDQYFRSGKVDGNKLTFTTETLHGVWFEFRGTVERGTGKNPADEAYYVLKGTLTESATDADKKVTTHPSEVEFKMFPAEASRARN
jgi:hypothetical protein